MKLAVLADIHGNARALDAVLAALDDESPDAIINLGDCAYGPFDPRPVMDRLLALDVRSVSGNEDRILVEAIEGVSHNRTAAFCCARLDRASIAWLKDLPLVIEDDAYLAFHGTPKSDTTYLLSTVDAQGIRRRAREDIERHLQGWYAPVVICGHDHLPRTELVGNQTLVVNPGSVGCPAYRDDVPLPHAVENGTPHARYAIVQNVDEEIVTTLCEAAYDWNAAAEEAAANGFPDWARWLATGLA